MTWIQVEPAPPKSKKSESDQNQRRIVQSDAGQETKEASPDAFYGDKTRSVDRQTVSSKRMTQMGRTGTSSKPAPQTERQKEQAKTKGDKGEKTQLKELAKFGLPILPEARRPGSTQALNQDTPQWANIGTLPQDYVDGVRESDRTALSTREYVYYGYHQRIRQRLELEWTRLLREALIKFYKNGRRLASDSEHTTRLLVILNARGEITRVKILSESGTRELDDVAVAAFNKAGPFPNPPKGLVDKTGEIEVSWEMKLRS